MKNLAFWRKVNRALVLQPKNDAILSRFLRKTKTAGARREDRRDETSRIKNSDKSAKATLRASGLFAPGAKRVALQASSSQPPKTPRAPLVTRPMTTGPAETRPRKSVEHHGRAAATEHGCYWIGRRPDGAVSRRRRPPFPLLLNDALISELNPRARASGSALLAHTGAGRGRH